MEEKFTVKVSEPTEEKGVQQVEQELLNKYNEEQQELAENQQVEETQQVEEAESTPELREINDADVLSYFKEKHDKDVNSIDELFSTSNKSLPEDVEAFYNYKKETGRGLNDYIMLNKDYNEIDDDKVLTEYYLSTKPHLDENDVAFEINRKFSYDEEGHEEWEKKERQIAKKEELAKARDYFNEQKAKYKIPVESTEPFVSDEDKENYEAFKEYENSLKSAREENVKKSEFFTQKTDELFNENFEGFKFNLNDNEYVYKPAEASKLKNAQSDINNFLGMFLDENGYVKDINEYHKTIAVAMNPNAFAKYFYEQGKSDAITDSAKKAKNIDMSVRRTPEVRTSGGMKISSISEPSSNGLRIRSKK